MSRVAVLGDFQKLELMVDGRRRTHSSRQDKGHRGEWRAFLDALKTGTLPIPLDEIIASSLATFRIEESILSGNRVEIDLASFLRSVMEASGDAPSEQAPAT